MYRKLAAVLVVALVLSTTTACGGSNRRKRGASNDDDSVSTGQNNNNGNAGKTGAPQSFDINKTVYYAAMKWTFGKLDYNPEPDPADTYGTRNGQLTIETTIENLIKTDVRPDVQFNLKVGEQIIEGRVSQDLTKVLGSSTSKTKAVFTLRQALSGDLKTGTLLVGRSDSNQPVVPFNGDGLVAYEPVRIMETPQTFNANNMKFVVKWCEIRADELEEHRQIAKDKRGLTCMVDAQPIKIYAAGEYFGAENFRLKMPDGSTRAPDSYINEALYGGKMKADQVVRFDIPWPAPGKYVFQMLDKASNEASTPQNTKDLTLTVN